MRLARKRLESGSEVVDIARDSMNLSVLCSCSSFLSSSIFLGFGCTLLLANASVVYWWTGSNYSLKLSFFFFLNKRRAWQLSLLSHFKPEFYDTDHQNCLGLSMCAWYLKLKCHDLNQPSDLQGCDGSRDSNRNPQTHKDNGSRDSLHRLPPLRNKTLFIFEKKIKERKRKEKKKDLLGNTWYFKLKIEMNKIRFDSRSLLVEYCKKLSSLVI